MNSYDCPQCGSHNTQSYENTHASNVRYSYGGTRGSFESWNQLAAQTAPPVSPHVGCGSIFIVFVLTGIVATVVGVPIYSLLKPLGSLISDDSRALIVFLAVLFASVATFIGGLIFTSKQVQKKLPDYQEKVAGWNRSMLCQRCGYAWQRNY